tara:strand:+ start:2998 stop:3597 length:600 start_codon:yes stop_codon:yes gene_type:complete
MVTRPKNNKAIPPKRGNALVIFTLVEDLGDWVHESMIFELVDGSQLDSQRSDSRKTNEYQKIKYALYFLSTTGRFEKRKRKYRVASFDDFNQRQKDLALKGSANALKEYYAEEHPFRGHGTIKKHDPDFDLIDLIDKPSFRKTDSVTKNISPRIIQSDVSATHYDSQSIDTLSFLYGTGIGAIISGLAVFSIMLAIGGT